MMRAISAALAISLASAHAAQCAALKIDWRDLRAATAAASSDVEPTLAWGLKDRTVEIAGYVLPSDREGDLVYQFLLIPVTGLCSHVAPPPPNQAILITLKEPFKLGEIYQTVSVTGTLKPEVEKTQLFILDGVSVIQSGYSIAGARIGPADKVTGVAEQPKSNPWSFLRKQAAPAN